MAEKKFVKLGESAEGGVFHDPISGFKVIPNAVVELPKRLTQRMKKALKGGHLEHATEAEYEAYLNRNNKDYKPSVEEDEVEEGSIEEIMAKFKKADLQKELDDAGKSYPKNAKHYDLAVLYAELQEEDEDEDDEDEDEDED